METYRDRKQSVYRVYAKSYDDDRRLMLGDQALTARITFIADALSGLSAVLDLGCGTGDLLCTLGLVLGDEACCVGVDLSREMLAVAQAKIVDCPHTYAIQTDVTQPLPFADETFDLVASLNLLQEVSAPSLVLEEVYRIPQARWRIPRRGGLLCRRQSGRNGPPSDRPAAHLVFSPR
jgi:ubiquinone/menaquinone biosynthesis C-methylase UbiE